MPVIHRARGWHAVWTGRTSRWTLPGDTPELAISLHWLNQARMLPPNKIGSPGWLQAPCPRCGRATAISHRGDTPTVCTGCRAERISEQVAQLRKGSMRDD